MPLRRIKAASFANYLFLFVSWAILSPYLQLYLKARGFSPSRIGLLLGAFELAGVAGPMITGRIADRHAAYRPLLSAAFVVSAACFLPLQFTTLFPVALAALVVMGLSYRSTIPLLDSLVTRVLPDPTRQYGRLRVAGSFGFILISLFLQLSGLVTGDSALPILVAFCAAAAAAAGAAVFLPRGHRLAAHTGSPHPSTTGFDARFWTVLAVIFLGRFGIAAYYSFFSLYLKQTFPGTGVSMLWAIGPAAEIITIWFSGRLIRRWGIRVMLTVSLAAISVRLCLFVAAPVLAVVAAAQVLHAFTFGTFHTTAVAWVNGRVSPERRGMGMSIYNAVGTGLPTVIATSLGGYVLQARGFTGRFLSYAVVPLLGIGLLAVFGRRLFSTPARHVS